MNKNKNNMRPIDIIAAAARAARETDETREADAAAEAAIMQESKDNTDSIKLSIVTSKKNKKARDNKKWNEALAAGEDRVIAEFQKSKHEKLVISVNDYKSHKFVDMRNWRNDMIGKGPSYRPTREGITIKPSIGQQVINAIHDGFNLIKAEEAAEAKKNKKN